MTRNKPIAGGVVRISLAEALARQWIGFTLALLALFVAAALLLLWILEDSFINRRLRDVAALVQDTAAPALPEAFIVWPLAALPADIGPRLHGLPAGRVLEFRRNEGQYVHLLWTRTPRGEAFVIAYDVSDQLLVNAGFERGLPWLLLLAVLLALSSWALARGFVVRLSRRAQAVLAQVRESPDPSALHDYARREPIREFSELARLNAEAWEQRLTMLERERQTLAFLAHELRTPLQSARTSLALLQDGTAVDQAWKRLRRAIDRLSRASQSILWLASDSRPTGLDRTPPGPLLDELAEELAPLASGKQQSIHIEGGAMVRWPLPREALETVLANLMLNAIQHGGAGRIELRYGSDWFEISNPLTAESGRHGFGLGLQIVQRLTERWGWTMTLEATPAIVARQRIRLQADVAPD